MPRSASTRTRSSLFSRSRPGSLPDAARGARGALGSGVLQSPALKAATRPGRRARRARRPGRPARRGTPSGPSRGWSRLAHPLELDLHHAGEADARLVGEDGPAVEVLDLAVDHLEAARDRAAVDRGAELAQVLDAEPPLRRALHPRVLARHVGESVEAEVDPDVGRLAADDDLVL